MGTDERCTCIAFYNSSNAVKFAFAHWKNKVKYRHPFLGMCLEQAGISETAHQAMPIKKVSTKDEHCLVFEVKRGRSSGYFRKPKNLIWFFIVPGSSQATAEDLVHLGVSGMLSRRIPEDEFFFGYQPAPERFTTWPFAMKEHTRLSA